MRKITLDKVGTLQDSSVYFEGSTVVMNGLASGDQSKLLKVPTTQAVKGMFQNTPIITVPPITSGVHKKLFKFDSGVGCEGTDIVSDDYNMPRGDFNSVGSSTGAAFCINNRFPSVYTFKLGSQLGKTVAKTAAGWIDLHTGDILDTEGTIHKYNGNVGLAKPDQNTYDNAGAVVVHETVETLFIYTAYKTPNHYQAYNSIVEISKDFKQVLGTYTNGWLVPIKKVGDVLVLLNQSSDNQNTKSVFNIVFFNFNTKAFYKSNATFTYNGLGANRGTAGIQYGSAWPSIASVELKEGKINVYVSDLPTFSAAADKHKISTLTLYKYSYDTETLAVNMDTYVTKERQDFLYTDVDTVYYTSYPFDDKFTSWNFVTAANITGVKDRVLYTLIEKEGQKYLHILIAPIPLGTGNLNYIGNTVQLTYKVNDVPTYTALTDGLLHDDIGRHAELVSSHTEVGFLGDSTSSMENFILDNNEMFVICNGKVRQAKYNLDTFKFELVERVIDVDAIALYKGNTENTLYLLNRKMDLYKMALGKVQTVNIAFDVKDNVNLDPDVTLVVSTYTGSGDPVSAKINILLEGPVTFQNGSTSMVLTTNPNAPAIIPVNVTGIGSIGASAKLIQ